MASAFRRKGSTRWTTKWRCSGCPTHAAGGWHNDPCDAASHDEALAIAEARELAGNRSVAVTAENLGRHFGRGTTEHPDHPRGLHRPSAVGRRPPCGVARDTEASRAVTPDVLPTGRASDAAGGCGSGQQLAVRPDSLIVNAGRTRRSVADRPNAAAGPFTEGHSCCAASAWSVAGLARWWVGERSQQLRDPRHAALRVHAWVLDDAQLAGQPCAALPLAEIERWMDRVELGPRQRRSPRTVNHARQLLSTLFTHALRMGELCDRHPNPVARASKRRVDERSFGWLRRDEVEPVLKAIEGRWRPMFALAAYAGLRKGEVHALRGCDVDLGLLCISVRRSWDRDATKSGRHRTVPISDALLVHLRPALDACPDGGPLFRSRSNRTRGRVMSESVDLPGMLRAAVTRAGLQHRLPMRFHDLRHSFASILVAGGVPMKLVSAALGHSSVSITERVYAHLDPDGSMDAIRDALK